MTKIVYNNCFGGFSLSHEAIMRYAEIKGITLYSLKTDYGVTDYFLCPPEEYYRIVQEEKSQILSIYTNRYARSNAMHFSSHVIERTDPALAQVVQELGKAANGPCAKLEIVELPAGTRYRIDEYDGLETVETMDTYEWKVA